MKAESPTLRSIHRFRNGTLCTLTFTVVEGIPRPHHLWNGPLPKFKGERYAWELSAWQTVANRTGREHYYAISLASGEMRIWRCRPGSKPQRVSPAEAFGNACLLSFVRNEDAEGRTWPLSNWKEGT
jgi:hypothetical protein